MDKTATFSMRLTEEQYEFLRDKSKEEDLTITTIINRALGEKYPEYKKFKSTRLREQLNKKIIKVKNPTLCITK